MTDGLFSLKKILTDTFEIPPYQRSYVWKSNETESKIGEAAIFFKDLVEYNNNKNEIKRYLFGPLIVQSKNDDLKQIIDGQQRMTTVMIFLCAARDLLNHSADSKVCNEIDADAIILNDEDAIINKPETGEDHPQDRRQGSLGEEPRGPKEDKAAKEKDNDVAIKGYAVVDDANHAGNDAQYQDGNAYL